MHVHVLYVGWHQLRQVFPDLREDLLIPRQSKNMLDNSDDVFEAVGGITGQPRAFAAATQVLTVRPLHVDVSLLLLTAAASLRATLKQTRRKERSEYEAEQKLALQY